ncbi:hypothetical protein L873DRAFT_1805962 [Choiromyces venosus 120613-1]|uniref:Uncharacterized protein n=1 Tax=Choiromyces venosus 120613-1 TaxID=1336337 RepID=A0A3N4JNN6_9PEZI|nr:hypothetical protein L873DRAFT_1805962 [Choiromyces venosus 120613-1]
MRSTIITKFTRFFNTLLPIFPCVTLYLTLAPTVFHPPCECRILLACYEYRVWLLGYLSAS